MELEKRLRKLENRNRVLCALVILMLGYIAVGQVAAAGRPQSIIADSITVRSFALVDSRGLKKVTIEDSNIGTGLAISDENGKFSLGLHVLPSGQPSMCFSDGKVCRVVLGAIEHDGQSQMGIDLRDANGHSIWMPSISNPYKAQ